MIGALQRYRASELRITERNYLKRMIVGGSSMRQSLAASKCGACEGLWYCK